VRAKLPPRSARNVSIFRSSVAIEISARGRSCLAQKGTSENISRSGMLFRAEEMIRSDVQIGDQPGVTSRNCGAVHGRRSLPGRGCSGHDARATSNESLSSCGASAVSVPPGGTAATRITPCSGRATASGEMSESNGNSSSRQEPNPAKNRQRLPTAPQSGGDAIFHVLRRFENWWLSPCPPGHILRPAPDLRRRPPP